MVMTVYSIAVFLHVLGMGGLFAATAIEWIVDRKLARVRSAEDVREALALMPLGMTTGAPSAVAILLTGGYMTHAVWSWDKPWIFMGFATMLLAFGLGGAGSARKMKAMGRIAAAESGPPSPALGAALADPAIQLTLRVRTGLLVSIVYLMTVRPELVGALVAPVVFAALGFAAARMRKVPAAA